ncbi:ferric iron reductase [Streptomyces dioscori]|uniref:Ferric iron reductase n=1 Tax=Streptomyces dioscori TaxID=2109333 RepID=A0A2P8Q2I8_9ACTN|nr:(2Fe-2S)-binding protein [Streptomyces dioscori]PSM40477.1 ferric iron reductase [Streptomyces dioscori]
MNLDPDLKRLAALEGFFALRTGRSRPRTGRPPLPTLAEVYATPGVTEGRRGDEAADPLGFRVRKVVRLLAAPEVRVGVSVAQQGLAARLWSVALGAAVLYGRVPDLDPRLLHWDADGSAPDDLWLSRVRALPGDAATIRRLVHHGHLEPLAAALRARHPVAEGLLWGNAASALASTARLLDGWAAAHGRTDVRDRVRALAAELLGHPDLRDTGTLDGIAFRRRSCCLYYRVPGGGVCGDCCFRRTPRSSLTDPSG